MFAHAQAPVRIGIAGGGTDLPAYTKDRVGRCLSLAIRSYTYAVAIERPDGQVVASYKNRDTSSSATEIANGLIRESALLHGWESGFEVHTLSELSSRGTGLGVSSSIAVALAACFGQLARLRTDPGRAWADFRYRAIADDPEVTMSVKDGCVVTAPNDEHRQSIARDAWTVEIDRLHRPIGRQDHMAAAHGGLRLYRFTGQAAEIERSFSKDDAEWLARHLCLVRLPEGHDARGILGGVKDATGLVQAEEAVPAALIAIADRDLRALGLALTRGQHSKRQIPGACPAWLDEVLLQINNLSQVYGCKVTGAGGGGHVVVACEPEYHVLIAQQTGLPVIAVVPDFSGVRSGGWR